MILRTHRSQLTSSSLLLLQLLWISILATAKKEEPRISKHKFSSPPRSPPLYFEDSDVILILDNTGNVQRSEDAGEAWGDIDIPEGQAWDVLLHPFNKEVAYVWGREITHWVTDDRGKSWRSFDIEGYPVPFRPPFSFHAADSDKVLINVCTSLFACEEMTYYSTDAFRTPPNRLRTDTRSCVFARSTPLFKTSETDHNDDRVVCVVRGEFSSPFSTRGNRLAVSDNYFRDEEEPVLEGDRTVQGIINIAVVKGFLVAAAGAKGTDELAMYVTDDAETWHRAVFPKDHKVEEDAYTILESTNYSIQVDVMTTAMPINAMGVLFTSNSNGTYFARNLEHTNRDDKGIVDFEKVSGIQGIVLANVVDNWQDVEESLMTKKKIKSKISFDDGRTFNPLTDGDDEIHLHSVSEMTNSGRVFSSPAPGLVMGVGNKGRYLQGYEEGDLYVSDNAGLTWRRAVKEAHKYEFGDRGSVLLAIFDEGPTDSITYSLDHGKTWENADIGEQVRAKLLTTTPDSTSLKFLILATAGEDPELDYYAIAVDFTELHEGKCKESDFEQWYARVNEKGEPTCIMGHKQWYRRRKTHADCFVDEEFKDPVPNFEPCACAAEDFECDYNFLPTENGKECKPAGAMPVPSGQCKNPDDIYIGSSGFRLIPGNDCDRNGKDAVELDKDVERSCQDSFRPPASGNISKEITTFPSKVYEEYYYLERTEKSQGDDETIIMRTDDGKIYLTSDAGKSWDQVLQGEDITAIYPHQHFNDVVFFLTRSEKVFYSFNRGKSFGHFIAPAEPTRDRLQILGFHANYKDWLIWTGAVGCDSGKEECHNVAFFSEDRGANWIHELRYVNKCEFIKEEGRGVSENSEKLVYCEQYQDELLSNPLQLKWSDNWFAEDHNAFDDIIDFATMSEFIVVAARREDDRDALTCHTSVDGKTFADAQFPPSFEVPAQKAYTVLESSTHAVFLHVTVSNRDGGEYGSIIKSNSNGTSYVMSLNGVNRNRKGYVDFEKMLGLEGVILVNTVANFDEVDHGSSKKLRTMITHNDGAQWAPLQAPSKDAEGNDFGCSSSNVDKCSLHLHSYTERRDPRATFSSPSAIGLMMGVGNVGEYLQDKDTADTFITRDGGVEWSSVKKGSYMWEYGDQGSIIVIVEELVPTKSVFYTLNEGLEWLEYQFSDTDITVGSLSTIPSDNSREFILWGKESDSSGSFVTVNLDFAGLAADRCVLNEKDPENGDYSLWEPKHPNQKDNCLFGHVTQYHRKKLGRNCFNGLSIQHNNHIAQNCSCTREDFEW